MTYPDKPLKNTKLPSDANLIEEYKILVDERRFVMTRYMQALGLYLILVAYTLKRIIYG